MSERVWCEHMAEGWIDNCKDCRIEKLEAEVERRHGIGGELIAVRRERDAEKARAEAAEADLKIANDALHDLDEKLHQAEAEIAYLTERCNSLLCFADMK